MTYYYYYLEPNEIIKDGDEYCFATGAGEWRRCRGSIGCTQAQHSRDLGRSDWIVRRRINKTSKGNIL